MKRCWTDVVFPCLRQCLPAPSQRSRPTACNGSFWKRIWGFPLLVKWGGGFAGSIPKRTNCERTGMVLECLFVVLQPNLSSLEQMVYCEQGFVFEKIGLLGSVDAVLCYGKLQKGDRLIHIHTYISSLFGHT